MDIATSTSADTPVEAVVVDPLSSDVPTIPVTTDPSRPPVAVPSMTVPSPSLLTTPIPIAPFPESSPREAPPSLCNAVTETPEETSADPNPRLGLTRPGPARPDPARPGLSRPQPARPDPARPGLSRPDPPDPASADPNPPDPAHAPAGFPPDVAAKLRCYVYLLVDPRSGRVFCVDRGRGDRCFRHVAAAGEPADRQPGTPGRRPKFAMLERIRQIEAEGRPVRIDILRYGLSASEASLVMASASDALGLPVDSEPGSQRGSAAEVGSRLAKRAKFKREHQVVLLRVGGTGADSTYERARHGWRIGRRWMDLGSPRSPRWALLVVADVIESVYRIERWEPTPGTPSGPAPRAATPVGRYSLVGSPDPELEDRYVGKSVAAYLGDGAPSQVTYVRCGPHWVNTAR